MPIAQTMRAIKGMRDRHKESSELFAKIDVNNDRKACRSEIATFVESNSQLWIMLSVNLGIPEVRCHAIATRVTMELASGKQGPQALTSQLTQHQFHKFRQRYILDPMGAQEYFHRLVFATFDADHNSYLDKDELEEFLETFYKADSIFHGDIRLPEKAELKRLILEKYDSDNEGRLSFEKVRGIISGHAMQEDILVGGGGRRGSTTSIAASSSSSSSTTATAVAAVGTTNDANKTSQNI